MASSSRVKNPRQRPRVNYREAADVKLPKPEKKPETLYPIEITESDSQGRVKIHYLGYNTEYDEWRDSQDVIDLSQTKAVHDSSGTVESYTPFSLYFELGTKIKLSLLSRRKESPTVRIELPFDKVLYEGGIKAYGTPSRHYRGVQRYRIMNYSDLTPDRTGTSEASILQVTFVLLFLTQLSFICTDVNHSLSIILLWEGTCICLCLGN